MYFFPALNVFFFLLTSLFPGALGTEELCPSCVSPYGSFDVSFLFTSLKSGCLTPFFSWQCLFSQPLSRLKTRMQIRAISSQVMVAYLLLSPPPPSCLALPTPGRSDALTSDLSSHCPPAAQPSVPPFTLWLFFVRPKAPKTTHDWVSPLFGTPLCWPCTSLLLLPSPIPTAH